MTIFSSVRTSRNWSRNCRSTTTPVEAQPFESGACADIGLDKRVSTPASTASLSRVVPMRETWDGSVRPCPIEKKVVSLAIEFDNPKRDKFLSLYESVKGLFFSEHVHRSETMLCFFGRHKSFFSLLPPPQRRAT